MDLRDYIVDFNMLSEETDTIDPDGQWLACAYNGSWVELRGPLTVNVKYYSHNSDSTIRHIMWEGKVTIPEGQTYTFDCIEPGPQIEPGLHLRNFIIEAADGGGISNTMLIAGGIGLLTVLGIAMYKKQ